MFSTQNIVKKFTNHLALDNVSITVPEGKIFGLLGPNGAGKTTLLRIINQITAPDSGEIFFDGHKLNSKDIFNIGYLPEERGLYKKMKVGEQSVYLARLKGLSKNDAIKNLKYWFEKFEMQTWWDKKVEELSKGMQQKVQFVITILHEPKLLIFDEPFSGFDPINANLLKQEILNIKDKGTTIIFSTHNMESVEELCDHIALINNSKKILEGPVNEIKEKYKSNTYDIAYKGSFEKLKSVLSKNIEVVNHKTSENIQTSRIKLLNGSTTNDFISSLLPHINLVSFNEVIPSINDIFIKVVKEANL
ncbi:MAG: ATP-binding cassette domain-containing protein [Bacteroidales bacterium]|nr:ATP-binding cassette domain-containing protein [Bacteroidales bacterium]